LPLLLEQQDARLLGRGMPGALEQE